MIHVALSSMYTTSMNWLLVVRMRSFPSSVASSIAMWCRSAWYYNKTHFHAVFRKKYRTQCCYVYLKHLRLAFHCVGELLWVSRENQPIKIKRAFTLRESDVRFWWVLGRNVMNGDNWVSLNDILWIQWITTKSNSSMVTRDILYLTIDIFLKTVVISNFPLLSIGWYLFRVVTGNRYLPRCSNENTLYITSTGNVSVARWVIPLVTILFLDLVMIHWIRWIQGKSFRENSNDQGKKSCLLSLSVNEL